MVPRLEFRAARRRPTEIIGQVLREPLGKKVIDSGKFVMLEDGSLWGIDRVDTIDTMLWLPASNISVCGNELVNTDDGEAVRGRRIR